MLRLLIITIVILFASNVSAEEVNINNANAEELADTLKGVGPVKAKAIIHHREENGPFYTAEELMDVKGIGPKTLEKIRKKLKLGNNFLSVIYCI